MMEQRPREGSAAPMGRFPDVPTHRPVVVAKPLKPAAESSLQPSSPAVIQEEVEDTSIGTAPPADHPTAVDARLLALSRSSFRLLSSPSAVDPSPSEGEYVIPAAPIATVAAPVAATQPPPYKTRVDSSSAASSATAMTAPESSTTSPRSSSGGSISNIKSAVLPAMTQIGKSMWSSMRDIRHSIVGHDLEESSEVLAGYESGSNSIRRRDQLPFHVSIEPSTQRYKATLSLLQRNLKVYEKSPQGARDNALVLGSFESFEAAKAACEAAAPPVWEGKSDQPCCFVCYHTFAMFRPAHHCRNCGQLVCSKCSSKSWPGNMLPSTFHNFESYLRVCCSCMFLAEEFATALRSGDLTGAQVVHGTGNVNLRSPLSIFVTADYPVHCAAQSGSVQVFSWLVEEMQCPLQDPKDGKPLLNACGLSPLAQAAKYGNAAIMRYLLFRGAASLMELESHNSSLLLRALHAALDAPGVLPDYKASSSAPFGADEDIAATGPYDPTPRLIYTKDKKPSNLDKKRGLIRAQSSLSSALQAERERDAQQTDKGSSAPVARAIAVGEGSVDERTVVVDAVIAR